MRKLIFLLLLILVFLAATYAALPWLLANQIAPRLAGDLGLDTLEIEAGYPGLDGLALPRITLVRQGITARAREVTVSYRLESLMAGRILQARLGSLEVELEVPSSLSESESEPSPAPGSDPELGSEPEYDPQRALALIPADRVLVDDLSIAVPELDFLASGRLALRSSVVELELTGLSPAFARDMVLAVLLDRREIRLTLSDQDTTSPSSAVAAGRIEGGEIPVEATFAVTGPLFEFAQQFLGIPPGSGSLSGDLATRLVWPPLSVPDWRELDASGSFELEWHRMELGTSLRNLNATFDLSRGAVTARVAADGLVEDGGATISSSIRDGEYRIDESGITSTDPGFRVSVSAEGMVADATLRSFGYTFNDSERGGALELSAALAAKVDGMAMKGILSGRAIDSDSNPSGTLEFQGEMTDWPIVLSSDYAYADNTLAARGRMQSGTVIDLPFSLEHAFGTGSGELIVVETLTFAEPILAATVPGFSEPFDLDRGTVRLDGSLRWGGEESPIGKLQIGLDDVDAHYDDVTAAGIAGEILLAISAGGWRLAPSGLNAVLVDVGFPLTEVGMNLSGTRELIRVDGIRASVLGGTASTTPFEYALEPGTAEFQLALNDIDLARLLALEGEDIAGTGKLEGKLPIQLVANVPRIQEGEVRSIEPGTIRLAPSLTSAFTQPGMDIALRALENFSYEILASSVDYDPDGNLQLGLRLEGRNPDIEGGRPIHYNLNISENVPVLLRSLRLTDAVSKTVEERVLR